MHHGYSTVVGNRFPQPMKIWHEASRLPQCRSVSACHGTVESRERLLWQWLPTVSYVLFRQNLYFFTRLQPSGTSRWCCYSRHVEKKKIYHLILGFIALALAQCRPTTFVMDIQMDTVLVFQMTFDNSQLTIKTFHVLRTTSKGLSGECSWKRDFDRSTVKHLGKMLKIKKWHSSSIIVIYLGGIQIKILVPLWKGMLPWYNRFQEWTLIAKICDRQKIQYKMLAQQHARNGLLDTHQTVSHLLVSHTMLAIDRYKGFKSMTRRRIYTN